MPRRSASSNSPSHRTSLNRTVHRDLRPSRVRRATVIHHRPPPSGTPIDLAALGRSLNRVNAREATMYEQQQLDSQSIEGLTLGERIVLAARLAVAKHLADSVKQNSTTQTGNDDARQRGRRQQIVIGGAGPKWVTDDPEKC